MYDKKNYPSSLFPLNLVVLLLVLSGCTAGGGGVGRDGNAEGGKININLGLGEVLAPLLPPSSNQRQGQVAPSCGDPYCTNPAHSGSSPKSMAPSCGDPYCENPAHYGASSGQKVPICGDPYCNNPSHYRPMIPLCGDPYCTNPSHYGPAP